MYDDVRKTNLKSILRSADEILVVVVCASYDN
jgi:hypothetical protein